MEIVAENASLLLRKVRRSDARFILSLTNQKSWINNIGDRHIYKLDDAIKYIQEGPIASYQRYGFGLYMVVRKKDKQALGLCGLLQRTYLDSADIGFAISEAFCKQGYGFESAKLLMLNIHQITPLALIYATARSSNIASVRLLLKLGFENLGPFSDDGPFDDLLLFSCKV